MLSSKCFYQKLCPATSMYISAVWLKTNLRVLYIAALISMVRSSLLKRPSSCRSSSSLSPTNSQCRSSLIERQIIDHQLRPEYLGKAGLVIFKELTKGMKRIRAIERKYPTSRGFIAMIQRKKAAEILHMDDEGKKEEESRSHRSK